MDYTELFSKDIGHKEQYVFQVVKTCMTKHMFEERIILMEKLQLKNNIEFLFNI